MYAANCYNVMIVSPSDTSEERKIVREVLYRWNELNSRFHNIIFSVLAYDINAHADSGSHPQESLNHQLLEDADLIIAIFGTKLGTPTKEYPSGSVEEISKHMEKGKKALIYFSKKKIEPDGFDTEQYKKLKNYQDSIKEEAFYKEFSSEDEFERVVKDDIQLIANELQPLEKNVDQQTSTQEIHLSKRETSLLIIIRTKFGKLKITSQGNRILFNGVYEPDERKVAEQEEAIESLENKGLIKATDGNRNEFKLTAEGYRVYDKLFKQ